MKNRDRIEERVLIGRVLTGQLFTDKVIKNMKVFMKFLLFIIVDA